MAGRSGIVGVLALQGDVREHEQTLTELGAATLRVRRAEELAQVSALVIPGGESTVLDKLARAFGVFEPLRAAIASGLPVFGTCAGLIMLSDTVLDAAPGQRSLGGLDVQVRRNAFGSQNESFEVDLPVPAIGEGTMRAAFIRAHVIETVGAAATILARLPDGRVVAVEQGSLLGASFHPEITGEQGLHEYFLEKAARSAYRPRVAA